MQKRNFGNYIVGSVPGQEIAPQRCGAAFSHCGPAFLRVQPAESRCARSIALAAAYPQSAGAIKCVPTKNSAANTLVPQRITNSTLHQIFAPAGIFHPLGCESRRARISCSRHFSRRHQAYFQTFTLVTSQECLYLRATLKSGGAVNHRPVKFLRSSWCSVAVVGW